jgi:hypothetical protein
MTLVRVPVPLLSLFDGFDYDDIFDAGVKITCQRGDEVKTIAENERIVAELRAKHNGYKEKELNL